MVMVLICMVNVLNKIYYNYVKELCVNILFKCFVECYQLFLKCDLCMYNCFLDSKKVKEGVWVYVCRYVCVDFGIVGSFGMQVDRKVGDYVGRLFVKY